MSKCGTFVWGCAALALAAAAPRCLADTIYLKNGQKIVAEVLRENEKQVVYESGGGEYTIPRALIDHIEKTPQGPAALRTIPKADLPLPSIASEEPAAEDSTEVVKTGALDRARLERLDNEVLRHSTKETRHRLAQGYHHAAAFLTRAGDAEGAIELYRHALHFAPDDLALTLALGYLLVKQTYCSEAVELLRPAAVQFPKSPDVPILLGSAYYSLDYLDRAIEQWNRSLALEENPALRQALEKAERERTLAGAYQERRSQHFILRYEGQASEKLATQVLGTLEAAFDELERDLDVYPRESIVVLLYPNETFRDITRSPSWVGALNDGKIRVPVSGLTSMTWLLARNLKHELTHSFVRQATLGRCPVWFNEGLAQLEEGATTATLGSQLARALADNRIPAFPDLAESFLKLSPDQVEMAYAKSLAALEFLRETYGMAEIDRLLKLMASNPDFGSLLQQQLQLKYPELEEKVAAYVEKRYGS